jgi:hypothetical protein
VNLIVFKNLVGSLALRLGWITIQHCHFDLVAPNTDNGLILVLAREHISCFREEQAISRKGAKLEKNKLTMRSKEEIAQPDRLPSDGRICCISGRNTTRPTATQSESRIAAR